MFKIVAGSVPAFCACVSSIYIHMYISAIHIQYATGLS